MPSKRYPLRRLHLEELPPEGSACTLDDDRRHYLRKVLRLRSGQMLEVFDGHGRRARAKIETQSTDPALILQAYLPNEPAPMARLCLGQALSSRERFDWAVQKSTELGVAEITPLETKHTKVRMDARRGAIRLRHWRGIAAHSCAQCGRSRLPWISPPQQLSTWLQSQQTVHLGLLLDPEGARLDELLEHRVTQADSIAILIGPEGGLSDTEAEAARAAGFQPIRLGPRILRTETAPLVILTLLQHRLGDI